MESDKASKNQQPTEPTINVIIPSEYNNSYKNESMCSLLLWVIMILLFMAMIWTISNMDCVSGFFTPPELTVMNELKNVPIMQLPPIDHNKLGKEVVDNFENDLPNQNIKLPEDNTSYADIAANMALEPEVQAQHKKYVEQRDKYTGIASANSERSDSQDIVTFVGLRRPSYLTKNGDSLVDPSARQVPTVVDPKTLSKPVNLSWNYGSFT